MKRAPAEGLDPCFDAYSDAVTMADVKLGREMLWARLRYGLRHPADNGAFNALSAAAQEEHRIAIAEAVAAYRRCAGYLDVTP